MQLNTNIQFCTTSEDLIRNIFLKQPFSTNSSELNCLLLTGHHQDRTLYCDTELSFPANAAASVDSTLAERHIHLQWRI